MNYTERIEHVPTKKDHNIKIDNRREVEISGIKEIDSFDSEEFLIETTLGYLLVRGANLQLVNLNVEEGFVHIKGKIYELLYVDEQYEEKAKGLFSKLFK